MENNFVLQMREIRKTFPGVVALDNVSFDLRRGEVHILLGENGAGKSTMMKILSGAYQKDSGQILLDGQEVEIRNPRHSRELGIGIIYQELNLVPHLSAAENIFLGREPSTPGMPFLIDQKAINQSARQLLTGLGVDFDPRRLVKELSIAEQQMVEIAKAISLDARILIMDEPTSALTEREITELFTRIRKLKSGGVSIIYISHRMEELFEIGDRVTVLRDGAWVGTRNIADVTKPELIQMMVNRELTQLFPKVTAPRGKEVLRVEGLNRAGALTDIRFSLCEGEVLGIAGLLGSGRTEMARAIFGLDKPDTGSIHVKGKLQKIASPRQAINLGFGFLTEDRKTQGLVLPLSVQENICLPSVERFSRLGVVSGRQEAEAAAQFQKDLRIKTTGLGQRVMNLSGGNQQKVVLSKWLCSRGDILIFDEPTRGIDVGSKAEIYQLMNQLTEAGAAIIMISSDLPEVLGMSDRILVMHQGRINGEFSAAEATQEKILHCALGETLMSLKTYVAQHGRQFGTLLGLLVLCVVMWILTPHFLTVSNLLNIAEQTAIIAIIAAGMTFIIITAGIDLSVGSVLAFSGVVMASLLQKGVPVIVALAVGIGVGFCCGVLNGLLISIGRLPPFIATLGMMSVARGAALLFTEGRPISGFSDSFRYLATGKLLGIPMPVLVMLAVFFIANFLLTKTKLGRYTYAIGGNEEATILSGVNVRLYKTLIYGICGGLTGLAAILLTARLNSAQPIAGMMYELDAIAATVIGGTSLMGGEGNVFGTLIGALIIGVLRNGLTLLNISSFAQQIIIGLVIIVAVLLDMALKKSKR